MYRFHILAVIVFLFVFSATSVFALTTGGGGDGCGGCEVIKWGGDVISRLAVSRGLDAVEAKKTYVDLIGKPYDELFIYKEHEHPCNIYGKCDGYSDDFLKSLVGIAMKYQEVEYYRQQSWWTTVAAIAAVLAFGISLVALRRSGAKS